MSLLHVRLTAKNSERADTLARESGKTPEQLVNEVFEKYTEPESAESEEVEKFRRWQEALHGIEGMWAGRDDLPDFESLRKSWDRNAAVR